MRTKCEIKRQKILDVAAQTFQESGFERASMDEIRTRVGGSKATLYHYFASKEELFFEVVFSAIEMEFTATHASLDLSNTNLSAALATFGEGLLRSLYSPCAIKVRRLIFAEAKRSDLGRIAYERGTQRSHKLLSDFLHAAMMKGKLRKADASMAAWHLYGLLDAKLLRCCLLCVQDAVTEEEIQTSVQQAVAVFLAAYGNPVVNSATASQLSFA
ncbi:MAG: TetR/AcrR family transcriptional regulator [Candidatus Competibacteraceae bacterium]|nr:TetR/AcrR family transcriptional regulator [Candidatus Competibacteraceae bacterium]